MSGAKSSRWFMFFQLHKQQKVRVGMSVRKETNLQLNVHRGFLFHSSPSVRISPARKTTRPPCGLQRDAISGGFHTRSSRSPDAALEVTILLTLPLSVKSQVFVATKQAEVQRQSKHYSSYFLPTNVWL
ncbi:hypothetical protein QQF64_022546 [Cirrhinus molitorella]|uniref:Uncharacterized protein n=1 Tax=Cirrhinus molitorella TaxID=172907 RepID=A0ABR3L4A6_9TELE